MTTEYIPEELFVVFDLLGPYEPYESEENAQKFCEQYNRRVSTDPLKPYTYKKYVLAEVGAPKQD